MEGANGDYHPDPGVDDDGFGYPDDSKRRERSRSRERRHKSSKEHRRRDRSRSRDRRRSRSRDKRRRGGGSRSRSRDRRRRSRSSRSRPRSRERRHHRRSRRSRSPSGSRSRSRSRSGGYRPRRRHEAARPAASMFATNDPFAHLRSKQPLDPAEAMRQWQEQMLKSRQLVLAQQAKSAVQAANKAQRELYIGNLAAGQVSDAMLAQVFNSALIAAFPEAGQPGQEPVVKVNIHTDGRYGFVEFRTAEYASAALELNGQINLMNQQLGIGRPASYVDPNKVQAAAVQAEAALAAFQQGLPLPPSAVSLPTALAPGSAGAAMAAAGNAAAGTHNAAAAAAGTLPLPPAAAADGGAAAAVAQQLLAAALLPTSFVEVAGMVTADALGDAEECEERALCCHLVVLDLREECERFGVVRQVLLPRPADPSTAAQVFGTGHYGKAYASFDNAVDAAKARERIHGRMFAGSMVTATYITAEAFEAASRAAAAGSGGSGGDAPPQASPADAARADAAAAQEPEQQQQPQDEQPPAVAGAAQREEGAAGGGGAAGEQQPAAMEVEAGAGAASGADAACAGGSDQPQQDEQQQDGQEQPEAGDT